MLYNSIHAGTFLWIHTTHKSTKLFTIKAELGLHNSTCRLMVPMIYCISLLDIHTLYSVPHSTVSVRVSLDDDEYQRVKYRNTALHSFLFVYKGIFLFQCSEGIIVALCLVHFSPVPSVCSATYYILTPFKSIRPSFLFKTTMPLCPFSSLHSHLPCIRLEIWAPLCCPSVCLVIHYQYPDPVFFFSGR